jgi:hypothetical protein
MFIAMESRFQSYIMIVIDFTIIVCDSSVRERDGL